MQLLVTGASGNVGAELVSALAGNGEHVRALSRAGAARGLPPAVEGVRGDLDEPASLAAPLTGVDGLFLLPGYRDMPGILEQARKAGVRRVVLLSGGSAGSGDMTNAVTAYMVRSETAVRESGLSWTILRPAAFMSNALRWKPLLAEGDVLRLPFARVRTATVDPFDIAAVAAAALTEAGHHGQIYQLTGPQSLLPVEQVEILARVLGRGLRFEAQGDEEARIEMSASMPTEYVDAFFDFYVAGSLDESAVLPTVEAVTGRAPRTFEEWARNHAGEFARDGGSHRPPTTL
jgi:uncharacterized protein YbjT (DUF2867 family)